MVLAKNLKGKSLELLDSRIQQNELKVTVVQRFISVQTEQNVSSANSVTSGKTTGVSGGHPHATFVPPTNDRAVVRVEQTEPQPKQRRDPVSNVRTV